MTDHGVITPAGIAGHRPHPSQGFTAPRVKGTGLEIVDRTRDTDHRRLGFRLMGDLRIDGKLHQEADLITDDKIEGLNHVQGVEQEINGIKKHLRTGPLRLTKIDTTALLVTETCTQI